MTATLRRSLTTLPLVFVIFFNVSGGAFTLEGLVASTGPGLAILFLLILPVVWALPETLLIGELGSTSASAGLSPNCRRARVGPSPS